MVPRKPEKAVWAESEQGPRYDDFLPPEVAQAALEREVAEADDPLGAEIRERLDALELHCKITFADALDRSIGELNERLDTIVSEFQQRGHHTTGHAWDTWDQLTTAEWLRQNQRRSDFDEWWTPLHQSIRTVGTLRAETAEWPLVTTDAEASPLERAPAAVG